MADLTLHDKMIERAARVLDRSYDRTEMTLQQDRPMQPFRLTGLITGHSLGLREGSKLWFPNDRYVVAEDMWVSLLNAHHHRICLIDRRYAFVPYKTFVSKGAQAEHRTSATLKDNFFRFREAFGDVVQKKPSTPRARAAYEYAITMRLPF
jgi:hypothetical protein